jgi:hypothetical protein
MPLARFSRFLPVCLAGVVAFSPSGRAQVSLGDAPTAPKDVSGLPGGVRKSDATAGFSVNANSREEMRSFYNAVYSASTGAQINSTSDVQTCFPGANASAFQDAVVRRINWFRAAAGIPASVTLNSADGADDQAAALMMSANSALSHAPPSTWECYTSSGSNAAFNSNLALGYDGADAITGYIWDFGSSNADVGHRRWLLYPQTQIMATGDMPAQGNFSAANATWVFDANLRGPRPATTHPYVAWPPQGFVPCQLAYPRWSFALSNADLSAATVTMQSNGVNMAITIQPYSLGSGENTIVWVPANLNAAAATTLFPFSGADTVYSIVVTNINNGTATTGFAYTVTLFDPSVPGADYIPTVVRGPAQPLVGLPYNYTCAPPDNPSVTGYQWLVAQTASGDLFDGAEHGPSNFIVDISPGYSVITNGPVAAGHFSFYLAMPDAADQVLQLNRVLLPAGNTRLSFASLLGDATTNQIAEVQISTTGGLYWQNLYSQAGTGEPVDSKYTAHSLSLSNYAGQSVLLRFNFHLAPGSDGSYTIYTNIETTPPVGWFIDNILITNTEQSVNWTTNSTSSTNFTFTPAQAGGCVLEAQALIFGQFPIGFGPITQVTAISNTLSISNAPPITTQPANHSPPPGGIATLSVKPQGASWTYLWLFDGVPLTNNGTISGSASNQLTINPFMASNAGDYSVVLSSSSLFVTSKVVQLTPGLEKTKPSVAITSPKLNSRTTAPVLRGTAADSVRVRNVVYWVTNKNNGLTTIANGPAALAAGTGSVSNWTIPASVLLPGTNILAVRSSNYSGLASPLESTVFFYQVPVAFQRVTNGTGGFTIADAVKSDAPSANPTELYVGESYTLTANPGPNQWLTNWMTNSGIAGSNKTLPFIMESNLIVTANFASNLFVGMRGRYDGIFFPTNLEQATSTNSGLIYNLELGTNGSYSCKVYLAAASSSVSGAFNRAGYTTTNLGRKGTPGGEVTLELNIPWQSLPRQITGLVSNAGGWVSTNLILYAAATNLDIFNNSPNYTLLLPQAGNAPDAPASYGYALLTNLAGMIHLGGALSDGTSFTDAALLEPINEADQFPVYASLYKNPGLLLGQLSLDAATNPAVPAGSLTWFKPAQKTGLYAGGFSTVLDVEGSPWTNSEAALAGLFPTIGAQLTFSGGGLASNLVCTVEEGQANGKTLKLTSSSTGFTSGSIDLANGQLTFIFSETNGTKVSAVTASGTVLQNTNLGGGFFLGATSATNGTFKLTP